MTARRILMAIAAPVVALNLRKTRWFPEPSSSTLCWLCETHKAPAAYAMASATVTFSAADVFTSAIPSESNAVTRAPLASYLRILSTALLPESIKT